MGSPSPYLTKLKAAQEKNNSWICIGLDPIPDKLPIQATHLWDEPVLPFTKAIIDATHDIACAFKPNLGFYLRWGAAGMIALERTIRYIPDEIPVIIDCKAGDIGHTQKAWADGLLDQWNADAFVTNPYVGKDAIVAAIEDYPTKGIYVLTRTSNPSAGDFQGNFKDNSSLSRDVLANVKSWREEVTGEVGVVMGATYPTELKLAREIDADIPFLIPGIGSQGGDLETAVACGKDSHCGPLISASRSIIYAGRGYDFADEARAAAIDLRDRINSVRGQA
ncbi:MAG: orotidine-5'-phosphate decarboxylase [Chloroflexota bacterium]